jgi:hypothetical protein
MEHFGGPPFACGNNLGDDGAGVPPLLARLFRHLARDLFLLGVVEVDAGAVLGPNVGALSVQGGRVVHAIEEFDELAIAGDFRVKDELDSLGVCTD